MNNMVIVNGHLTGDTNLILDNGYFFGRGVFETILVKQQAILLDQHCERLKRGLRILNIQSSVDHHYILKYIKQYRIRDCVLKIIVSEKNVVMTTRKKVYTHSDYENGLSVIISDLRRNPFSHITYIKSLNYMDNILEKEKANRNGFGETIFFNTNNDLAEGSISNIFLVKDGQLFTPEIGCGILDGIVREWVIKEFDVREGKFTKDELMKAEEVFMTNSVMGIMKVSEINGSFISKSNKVYHAVRKKYEAFID